MYWIKCMWRVSVSEQPGFVHLEKVYFRKKWRKHFNARCKEAYLNCKIVQMLIKTQNIISWQASNITGAYFINGLSFILCDTVWYDKFPTK